VNLQVNVVMNYSKDINSFYTWMNDDDRLAPGIDVIIGGSQSQERL
jgi:aspartyl/asparaginyl-tRNA synthetase